MAVFFDQLKVKRLKSISSIPPLAIKDNHSFADFYENKISDMSRTFQFVVDYTRFLAARKIQRHWRGYRSRTKFEKLWKAAITIQRWWRGFWVRKNHFDSIEQRLQSNLRQYYDRAATKIQALFRGWWVRHTKHNMAALQKIQICAGEDLLNCVAFKLHYLMRTHSIPGVYSIYNSQCLSRVEKLMANMKYRVHNRRVQAANLNRQAMLEKQRKFFKNAREYTQVPFAGSNYKGLCKQHCEDYLTNTKDIDERMFMIIAAYDEAQRAIESKRVKYSAAEKKRRKQIQKVLDRKKLNRSFCGDVIASMRRWNIWDGVKVSISKDIFRNPENIKHFLDEAIDISLAHNCHCKMQVFDIVICH